MLASLDVEKVVEHLEVLVMEGDVGPRRRGIGIAAVLKDLGEMRAVRPELSPCASRPGAVACLRSGGADPSHDPALRNDEVGGANTGGTYSAGLARLV